MKKLLTIITFLSLAFTLSAQSWDHINYEGAPWVENISKPYKVSKGLNNRHLTVWASHGRYYDNTKDQWIWQRPIYSALPKTFLRRPS